MGSITTNRSGRHAVNLPALLGLCLLGLTPLLFYGAVLMLIFRR